MPTEEMLPPVPIKATLGRFALLTGYPSMAGRAGDTATPVPRLIRRAFRLCDATNDDLARMSEVSLRTIGRAIGGRACIPPRVTDPALSNHARPRAEGHFTGTRCHQQPRKPL